MSSGNPETRHSRLGSCCTTAHLFSSSVQAETPYIHSSHRFNLSIAVSAGIQGLKIAPKTNCKRGRPLVVSEHHGVKQRYRGSLRYNVEILSRLLATEPWGAQTEDGNRVCPALLPPHPPRALTVRAVVCPSSPKPRCVRRCCGGRHCSVGDVPSHYRYVASG